MTEAVSLSTKRPKEENDKIKLLTVAAWCKGCTVFDGINIGVVSLNPIGRYGSTSRNFLLSCVKKH
jgi:hypothetical protein